MVKHAGVKEAGIVSAVHGRRSGDRDPRRGPGLRPRGGARPESFGLLALRERLEELGGGLSVQAAPGKGVVIAARVPIRREES